METFDGVHLHQDAATTSTLALALRDLDAYVDRVMGTPGRANPDVRSLDPEAGKLIDYWESEVRQRKARGENYITVPGADNKAIMRILRPFEGFVARNETWHVDEFVVFCERARNVIAEIVAKRLLNERT